MSATQVLVIMAAVWVTIGLVLAVVMGRRGYDPWVWLVLGAVLGPLSIPFVIARVRPVTIAGRPRTEFAAGLDDKVAVLVGIDGSPESMAAARGVQDLLGSRLGRVTLVTVIPFDAAAIVEREAEETLCQAEASFPAGRAQRLLLQGFPAHELREHAKAGGYDTIAIGTTGRGLRTALLGSVATELAHRSKLPVILFGSDR